MANQANAGRPARQVSLWAYNEYSEGAKELANALGIKRIKREGSKYQPGAGKVIINWGDSKMPLNLQASTVLNSPFIVGAMSNKLKFFELMGGSCRLPEWTTNPAEAAAWFDEDPKAIVVERHKLNGHSADGLRLCEKKVDIQVAPLYTKYQPKKDEYRVHFVKDRIIDVQQKKKRLDFEGDANFKVRNHANGFIYARNDLDVPEDVRVQALACAGKAGLDFGCVDIIFNAKLNQAFCLEINTAPGLAGETVEIYAKALKELVA